MFSRSILIGFILSSTIVLAAVDFNRDVRPILASKCYACHGPDEESRKAKLRLDVREQALKRKPLFPVRSKRANYTIGFIQMTRMRSCLSNSHEPMSAEEKAILDQWIQEGAEYDKHWSFEPPVAKKPPELEDWGRNPIDSFVLRSMHSQDLQPSKEADPTPWFVGYTLTSSDCLLRLNRLILLSKTVKRIPMSGWWTNC